MKAVSFHLPRVAGLLCVAIWLYLACFRGSFWRLRERLRAPGSPVQAISVTAIIPARNESKLIGVAIRSLRSQAFAPLRIVVADDESEDGTSRVAVEAGADIVHRVLPRPSEWKGKLWAVSEGIRASGDIPEYFLLTDADIEYASPAIVSSLIGKAAEGYDLVSVMVSLRCRSFPEKFLIPAFVFFFFKLYPPAWVASKPGVAAAAGGCMLVRATILRRIGGIAVIRTALIDDCALAKQVKSAGGRVWSGVSDLPINSLREYPDWADIRAMISRSAFAQLRHSTLLLAGTILGMLITYIAPLALLFSGDTLAAGLGVCAWLIGTAIFLPTVRAYNAPLWTALCLPAIAAFYLWATLESALNYWTGRGGQWKGRLQDRGHDE